ncbi:RNA polymerase sigma factor [Larkinella arboricola]
MDQINKDQQILERLRNNDQRAWREVYEGNRSKVINYLRRYSTPEEVAVEIYQDTLVFLDERKHILQLESRLSTFLIGVAFNKLRARWKANSGKFDTIKFSSTDDDELNLLQFAFVDELQFEADSDEPDAMIQQALAQVQLKHCTDLFRLVYYEQLDQRQVADTLGMSYGSVRNQLLDCKKKMKTILLKMGWGQ